MAVYDVGSLASSQVEASVYWRGQPQVDWTESPRVTSARGHSRHGGRPRQGHAAGADRGAGRDSAFQGSGASFYGTLPQVHNYPEQPNSYQDNLPPETWGHLHEERVQDRAKHSMKDARTSSQPHAAFRNREPRLPAAEETTFQPGDIVQASIHIRQPDRPSANFASPMRPRPSYNWKLWADVSPARLPFNANRPRRFSSTAPPTTASRAAAGPATAPAAANPGPRLATEPQRQLRTVAEESGLPSGFTECRSPPAASRTGRPLTAASSSSSSTASSSEANNDPYDWLDIAEATVNRVRAIRTNEGKHTATSGKMHWSDPQSRMRKLSSQQYSGRKVPQRLAIKQDLPGILRRQRERSLQQRRRRKQLKMARQVAEEEATASAAAGSDAASAAGRSQLSGSQLTGPFSPEAAAAATARTRALAAQSSLQYSRSLESSGHVSVFKSSTERFPDPPPGPEPRNATAVPSMKVHEPDRLSTCFLSTKRELALGVRASYDESDKWPPSPRQPGIEIKDPDKSSAVFEAPVFDQDPRPEGFL